jgi:hypothetical protein
LGLALLDCVSSWLWQPCLGLLLLRPLHLFFAATDFFAKRMNVTNGQPPWDECRQQLVRALQESQSTNKFDPPKKHQQPQPLENGVQHLHSRITAVKAALLSSSTPRHRDDASLQAAGSAAATVHTHAARGDLDAYLDLSAGEGQTSAHAANAAQAIFNEAMAAHEALDFASALPLFKLAGDSGHGASCGYMALYFIEGRATAIDRQQVRSIRMFFSIPIIN